MSLSQVSIRNRNKRRYNDSEHRQRMLDYQKKHRMKPGVREKRAERQKKLGSVKEEDLPFYLRKYMKKVIY